MRTKVLLAIVLIAGIAFAGKKVKKEKQEKQEKISEIKYGMNNAGTLLQIEFEKGAEFNHPLYAIWLANEQGDYIQTLFVVESIGKGVFKRGSKRTGKWLPGEIQRPAALPYWVHQRNVQNENGGLLPTPARAVPDAYTGATPTSSFVLQTKTDLPLKGKYLVFFEINQSWDWNDYWYNDKYPHNSEYKTSSQPALVYQAMIDASNPNTEIRFTPIGHSHYAGENGLLNRDIRTLTTALKIAKSIRVRIVQ